MNLAYIADKFIAQCDAQNCHKTKATAAIMKSSPVKAHNPLVCAVTKIQTITLMLTWQTTTKSHEIK